MVELESQERKIKFLIHDRTWCEVQLFSNDEMITLGGGSLEKIISNLLISFIPQNDRKLSNSHIHWVQ